MDKELVGYLLGQLSEAEQLRFERQYFADSETFEDLLAAEQELIFSYVRGELGAEERKQFETHFLRLPRQAERVRFAKAIVTYLAQREADKPAPAAELPAQAVPWWKAFWDALRFQTTPGQFAFAAATLGIFAVSVSLGVNGVLSARNGKAQPATPPVANTATLEQQLSETKAKLAQVEAQLKDEQELLAQVQSKLYHHGKGDSSVPVFAALSLFPITVRGGGEMPKVVLSQGTNTLRLSLSLLDVDDYASFRVTVTSASGKRVANSMNVKAVGTAERRKVVASFPAKAFTADDYIVSVQGVTVNGAAEDVADYSFTVER